MVDKIVFLSQNNPKIFECSFCEYITSSKKDFNKHNLTIKHVSMCNGSNDSKQNPKPSKKTNKIYKSYTCKCGNTYKYDSGYYRHKKICTYIEGAEAPHTLSLDDIQLPTIPTNIFFELIKQNQEFKQLLIDQNKQLYEKHEENIDLQKQLLDVVKDGKTIHNNTISNNNNNSNNKTFNLQFFLNETCKDAMNMKDFINSLEMSFTELEKMGEIGFAEGMSRLFVDRLNKLDITKRPIHCSDVKREIIHIKDDNKWERDNANLDRLRKIIRQITHKNILHVDDWKQANKGCTEYNSRKNALYLKMNIQAIGPVEDEEVKREFGKIIRRVAETTAIDKKYLLA